MYETKPYFYGTGRRKHSVARVRVYNGTGKITINNRDIDDYFGLETLKLMVRSPLALTNTDGKFDIVINVVGRSEERRVGKSVDLGGRRIIKKNNKSTMISIPNHSP